MLVDSSTKVILLPKQKENEINYRIIKLPIDAKSENCKSFLIGNSQLYELIEIKGNNTFSNKNQILLKNGGAVKSFIFESEPMGSVLQSPNVIVSSKFNLAYTLILLMYRNENFCKRFITFEDIIDTLTNASDENSQWTNEIPRELYISSLNSICEAIVENNEKFFKFSIQKTISFLEEKTDSISNYIQERNNSIILKIRAELSDPSTGTSEIPKDILGLAVQRYAVDLICNSYIPSDLKCELIEHKKFKFESLEAYKKELNAKKKEIEVIESNMNTIAENSSKVKSKKIDEKKKTTRKTTVKKVAVGKGALDGFFKKA